MVARWCREVVPLDVRDVTMLEVALLGVREGGVGQEKAGSGDWREGGEEAAEKGGEEEEQGLAEGEGDSLHGGDAEGVLLEAEDSQGLGHVGLVVLGGEGGGHTGGEEGGVHTWERSERDWREGDRKE